MPPKWGFGVALLPVSELYPLARNQCLGPDPPSQHKTASRKKGLQTPFFSGIRRLFPVKKVGEFSFNPGSRTKFANLLDFALRWLVHSKKKRIRQDSSCNRVFAPKVILPEYLCVLAPGVCEYNHYIHTEGGSKGAHTCFKNNSSPVLAQR